MKAEIELNAKWMDKADNDVVFLQQREDKVVGIYDFGQHSMNFKEIWYQSFIGK